MVQGAPSVGMEFTVSCQCQSGSRSLVLLARNFFTDFSEVIAFAASVGWDLVPHLDAIVIELGPSQRIASVSEVGKTLRTLVDERVFAQIRAAWVSSDVPLPDQLGKLVHAEPLSNMLGSDSSPLFDILYHRKIETWYQPIFDARTMEVWGYECLMRSRDDQGKLISPADLLRWARQENMLFMLDRVCRETHLINAGKDGVPRNCHILLNFLPTSIYQPEFCLRTTVECARRSNIPFEKIIFEVIESEFVQDMGRLRKILDFYRQTGFQVAVDDVGSGFSGLTTIADLDPNLIKIDRELIVRSADSPPHRDVCRALVDLGHSRDKLVLAEGVETEQQRDVMLELGVDLFQGFLFARPAPKPLILSTVADG
jgi:EAL domain-containing protein (putative c-di-GMP-specific phosphodiesterase class I)